MRHGDPGGHRRRGPRRGRGDGRLLDNGNGLTAWTYLGLLEEHTPDGTVVWQDESELGTAVGRVTMLPDRHTLERAGLH